jgi:hypothetical protein
MFTQIAQIKARFFKLKLEALKTDYQSCKKQIMETQTVTP